MTFLPVRDEAHGQQHLGHAFLGKVEVGLQPARLALQLQATHLFYQAVGHATATGGVVHAEVAQVAGIGLAAYQHRGDVVAIEDAYIEGVAICDGIGQYLHRGGGRHKLRRVGIDLLQVSSNVRGKGDGGDRNQKRHDNSSK